MKRKVYTKLLEELDGRRSITVRRAQEIWGSRFSESTWKRIKRELEQSDGLRLRWDPKARVFKVPATWTALQASTIDPRKRDQLAVLRAAAARVGPPLTDRIGTFLDTLDAQLGKIDPEARAKAPVRQPAPRADKNFFDLLNKVDRAIRNHNIITFKYRKSKGGPVENRAIAPYAVHDHAGRFYVWGTDEGDTRTKFFALDRIENLTVDPEDTFDPDPRLSIDDELRYSFGIWAGAGKPEDIVVEVSETRAADIWARRWPAEKSCSLLSNGRLRITLSVNDPREVVAWVLSFGGDARILEPASAARLAYELGQKVVHQHQWAADVPSDSRLMHFDWGPDGLPTAMTRS